MILYEDEKYSCVKCIRGHRSTSCKHIDRVLIKVNKRGRRNVENKLPVVKTPGSGGDLMNSNDDVIIVEHLSNVNISKQKESVSISPVGGQLIKLEDEEFKMMAPKSCCSSKNNAKSEEEDHDYNCDSIKEPLLLIQPANFIVGHESQSTQMKSSSLISNKISDSDDFPGTSSNLSASSDFKRQKQMTNIDIFKNNDIFLETKCSCQDDSCGCENCIIHRLDEDLDNYISTNLLTYPSKNIGKGFIHQQAVDSNSSSRLIKQTINNENIDQDTNVITLKEIFLAGFNNLCNRINNETRLNVNGKEIPYVAWQPQIELYNKDIITMLQLMKILETL
ncbi:hypothetical protein QEN19_002636 [Hanseniaspora menglaensis]